MSIIDLTIGRATNDVLEAATAVYFKDEDEIGGVATGPIWIEADDGSSTRCLVPFGLVESESDRPADEDRAGGRNTMTRQASGETITEWFAVTDAEALADHLSVPLVRS